LVFQKGKKKERKKQYKTPFSIRRRAEAAFCCVTCGFGFPRLLLRDIDLCPCGNLFFSDCAVKKYSDRRSLIPMMELTQCFPPYAYKMTERTVCDSNNNNKKRA